MHRALILCVMLAGFVAARPASANPPDFRLQVVPAVVYKVDDPGNTGTSSLVFDIAVTCFTDCALSPLSASVELSNGRSTVERQEWTPEQLAKITGMKYRVSPDTPVEAPRRLFPLPEAFDLHFYFRLPQALAIGSAHVRIQVADAKGRRRRSCFPFVVGALLGRTWARTAATAGASAPTSPSTVRGLDQNHAEQINDAGENASAAGWGREILAPAAGLVTYARNDVPDNPRPGDPGSNALAVLHDPTLAFMGNCVVIDHGNSEYSLLAHMQYGSVPVKAGERVAAGQVIGKLGNSGNSFGPHLHYQLQSGPQPFRGQSLPFRFQGIDGPQLSRGRYFNTP